MGAVERAEEMEVVATKSRPLWIQTMAIVTMRTLVIRKKQVQDSRISWRQEGEDGQGQGKC